MRYRDEKFYWTYQHGVGWPDDYVGPDSMTWWIIVKSVGFTDVGLLTLSNLGLSIPLSNLGGGRIRLSSITPDSFDGFQ